MPPARFEPAILARERPQTRALCRAVPGIMVVKYILQNSFMLWVSKLHCWSWLIVVRVVPEIDYGLSFTEFCTNRL